MKGTPNTHLVEGTTPAEDDQQVTHAILKAHKRSVDGASEWTFAVRNEAGMIYRKGIIQGLDGMMNLDTRLGALGYENELLESTNRTKGLDAIFSKR